MTVTTADDYASTLAPRSTHVLSIIYSEPHLDATSLMSQLGAFSNEPQLPNIAKQLKGTGAVMASNVEVSHVASVESRLTSKTSSAESVAERRFTTCEKLLADLAEIRASVNPKQTVLLKPEQGVTLVQFDACVPRLAQEVELITVTADHDTLPKASSDETAFVELESQVDSSMLTIADFKLQGLDDTPEGVTKINSEILTGLIAGFFFIVVVLIGLNCALSIETPVRYATPEMVLKPTREY